jgi:putative ABC transport system substrate-binding protein
VIDRRTFVSILAGICLLEPLAVRAQQAGKIVRIGLLIPETEPTATMRAEVEAFRAGLRDLGWVEGENIIIETRWAGSNPQRQRALAAQLKAVPVTLILALGTTSIASARDGATGLPVVMINAGDPIGSKFVDSLSRPSGNLTGTSAAGEEVLSKQVELLSAAVPNLRTVGVLMNRANPVSDFFFDAISQRARSLGLSVARIDVAVEDQLDSAVSRAHGGALVVVTDPMFLRRRHQIAAQALRSRVPSVYGRRDYVEAGGLMSYVSSPKWHWRSAAGFVDKILKGAKPADIPVEQPTKFELVINMKTAQALGITIPRSLLQFADEVIE